MNARYFMGVKIDKEFRQNARKGQPTEDKEATQRLYAHREGVAVHLS